MKFRILEGQLGFVFHLLYRETSLSFLQQSKVVIGHTHKKNTISEYFRDLPDNCSSWKFEFSDMRERQRLM